MQLLESNPVTMHWLDELAPPLGGPEDDAHLGLARELVRAHARRVVEHVAATMRRRPRLWSALRPDGDEAGAHAALQAWFEAMLARDYTASALERRLVLGRRAARAAVTSSELVALIAAVRAPLLDLLGGALSGDGIRRVRGLLDRLFDVELAILLHGHASASASDPSPALSMSTLLHEIGGPLTAVQLQLEQLARRVALDSGGVQRVGMLIDDVARLSRIVRWAGRAAVPALALGEHDLRSIARRVVALEAAVAEPRGVALAVRSADTPVLVACDGDRMHQVIRNLVRNALEAAASFVEVEVAGERDAVYVVVRDDGPGIAAEILDRLGQPFVTTKPDGTGIGLVVVMQTVAQHGGSTHIRCTDGSEVTVRLPRS